MEADNIINSLRPLDLLKPLPTFLQFHTFKHLNDIQRNKLVLTAPSHFETNKKKKGENEDEGEKKCSKHKATYK